MPDSLAYFGRQNSGVGFSYASEWGDKPGVARIFAPLDFGTVNQVADLNIAFNDAGVLRRLALRDCLLARVSNPRSTSQGGLYEFAIEDRRWKWQFGGRIDGDYNFQLPDKSYRRQKSLRELVGLLFDALNEQNPKITALPNDVFPRAQWYAAKPIAELMRLLDDFGFVVTLNVLTNRAEVHRIGEGEPPRFTDFDLSSNSNVATLPAPPDGIRIIGGPVLFQSKWLFRRALGLETDGTYKPLDELSYRPDEGFGNIDPNGFDAIEQTYTDAEGVERQCRDLARASVWRSYQLSWIGNGLRSPVELLGTEYEPQSLHDLGPLFDVRLEIDPDTKERLPAYVETFGLHQDLDDEFNSWRKYYGSWTYDPETQIVHLGEQVYANGGRVEGEDLILPGEVRITAAYTVTKDGVPLRYERFRQNQNQTFGAGEQCEWHAEIVYESIDKTALLGESPFPVTGNVANNREAIEKQCDYYLDSLNQLFVTRTAQAIELPGIKLIAPDGILRTVSWSFSTGQPPLTNLGYNCEPNPYRETWENRKDRIARKDADESARRAEKRRNDEPRKAR